MESEHKKVIAEVDLIKTKSFAKQRFEKLLTCIDATYQSILHDISKIVEAFVQISNEREETQVSNDQTNEQNSATQGQRLVQSGGQVPNNIRSTSNLAEPSTNNNSEININESSETFTSNETPNDQNDIDLLLLEETPRTPQYIFEAYENDIKPF